MDLDSIAREREAASIPAHDCVTGVRASSRNAEIDDAFDFHQSIPCHPQRGLNGIRQRSAAHWLRAMFVVLIVTQTMMLAGCVSRRMTFVSNPPGAMVLLEGREIGYSPASADFIYYGTRQVTMIKDGYETKTDLVTIPAPWYQWPVIEFFADNFWPHRVTDRRVFTFDLQPKQMIPDEELRSRARQLRSEGQIGQ